MQKSVEKNPLISEDVRITLAPRRKRNRIWEIDFLRGVCVILMILDHLAILLGRISAINGTDSALCAEASAMRLRRFATTG